ncbi:hypothetical protein AVEN_223752-1 [Araneus ventricosus]|uniref:FAD dependent oxidoreductase domain-containing protein n=1 Tax=Araneus ventricosus TaxID=182803 RepID=A0A4Y2TRT0_ARAVE|nr:hypothetical protein AVEN_223752-1 [Araneus ventricosus]
MHHEVYDLCIVGAGMYGSAAARHASAHSAAKVCLIGPSEPKANEKETREILSSHYDEGRIVHIAYASPVMQVLVRHTIKRFREIEKLSGIPFFSPVGTIVTAERGTSYFYHLLQEFEMRNVNYIDLSEGDIMKQRFPYLKLDDRDHPLFDDDGAGYVRARAMVEAQKKVAHKQGCRIVDDIVEEVRDLKDGAHEIITEKGHVLKAKKVLFCTGAFTEFKKFDPLKKLKIQVNKRTAAMLRISEEEKDRISSMPAFLMYRNDLADMPAAAKGAYILPPIKYPDEDFPKSAADQVSSSPPLNCGQSATPVEGRANRKNPFYSAWNLFKLGFTVFGDPTCGVTKLHFRSSRQFTMNVKFSANRFRGVFEHTLKCVFYAFGVVQGQRRNTCETLRGLNSKISYSEIIQLITFLSVFSGAAVS